MKKILVALLLPILLLPMVVNADIQVLHAYYNENVKKDGEVKVTIPVSYDKEYNWEITYDTKYLKTDETMISISPEKSYRIIDDKSEEVDNLKEVKVTDGKITIKAKMLSQQGLVDDDGVPVIIIRFIAIQPGETSVSIVSKENDIIASSIAIKITGNDSNDPGEVKPQEPEKKEDAPKGDKNKDLIFYGSLLVCVLQLVIIIILVIACRKKCKTKQEPNTEVVEEKKE